jgi:hypothetical protein
MSATTPPSDGSASSGSEAARALRRFDDLLFANPEVCSHCFARIRDHTEHTDAPANRLGTGNRPTETLERAGSGTVGQDVTDHDEYGARQSYHGRTYCGECGSPGGTNLDHTTDKQTLRRRLDAIVRRLHEAGMRPDLATLYGAALSLKADPDHQGQDRELLATAVHLGLKHGRPPAEVTGRPRADLPDRPVWRRDEE